MPLFCTTLNSTSGLSLKMVQVKKFGIVNFIQKKLSTNKRSIKFYPKFFIQNVRYLWCQAEPLYKVVAQNKKKLNTDQEN